MRDAVAMLKPRRKVAGMSAVLLPFAADGSADWPAFEAGVRRTADAGLTPAVNMDTGYGNLIDDATRLEALRRTRDVLGPKTAFAAGAFVADRPGSPFDADAYVERIDEIQARGGTPVIFQSHGLTGRPEQVVANYQRLAGACDFFIAFELGTMFAPFGAIYDLDIYEELIKIPQCIGAKHSSLDRELEWQRLDIRDRVRPDFLVLTGNDLAIDMVMYGSDYLLGLSTFAPELFARRDAFWEAGDPRFYELNDRLQYLGFFAFRSPVPAYKHAAAMSWKMRGWAATDLTHPQSPTRPESDRDVLRQIGEQLGLEMTA